MKHDLLLCATRTARPSNGSKMGRFPFSNMRSPAFPPRRPSGFIRILIPTFLLIFVIYHLRGDSSYVPAGYVHDHQARPPYHTPDRISDKHESGHLSKPEKAHDGSSEIQEPIYDEAKKPTPSAVESPTATATDLAIEPVVSRKPSSETGASTRPKASTATKRPHPIDDLIARAEEDFAALVAKESKTLKEAAAAYRTRRGRHPPPGFDEWYRFAVDRNATMVEDFFDQIYDDLNPFWALSPALIRKEANRYEMTINVRNGKASAGSDWFWTKIWLDLVRTIEHLLPDMDLALNAMDEPRIVVHWEQMREYIKKERKTRVMPPPEDVHRMFKPIPASDHFENSSSIRDKAWESTSALTENHLLSNL